MVQEVEAGLPPGNCAHCQEQDREVPARCSMPGDCTIQAVRATCPRNSEVGLEGPTPTGTAAGTFDETLLQEHGAPAPQSLEALGSMGWCPRVCERFGSLVVALHSLSVPDTFSASLCLTPSPFYSLSPFLF